MGCHRDTERWRIGGLGALASRLRRLAARDASRWPGRRWFWRPAGHGSGRRWARRREPGPVGYGRPEHDHGPEMFNPAKTPTGLCNAGSKALQANKNDIELSAPNNANAALNAAETDAIKGLLDDALLVSLGVTNSTVFISTIGPGSMVLAASDFRVGHVDRATDPDNTTEATIPILDVTLGVTSTDGKPSSPFGFLSYSGGTMADSTGGSEMDQVDADLGTPWRGRGRCSGLSRWRPWPSRRPRRASHRWAGSRGGPGAGRGAAEPWATARRPRRAARSRPGVPRSRRPARRGRCPRPADHAARPA
jgi:hypothetical protein